MVTRLATVKSIKSVLAYNEKKVEASAAQLLWANGFPMDMDSFSFKNKLDFFKRFTRQNTRTKSNTLHISVNFSPKDAGLDKDKLIEIAKDYMQGIGFGGQPFLVYQHFDAAHPHLHITTVTIANGGQQIKTYHLAFTKSDKIRKELEETYGLIKAEDQKKERDFQLQPILLEKVIYGQVETIKAVSAIVSEVVESYKYCSLTELNAALNQFGVYANGGALGSRLHNNGGLVYGILDQNNKKVGVPIKASSIYSSPTLKNLKKLFPENKLNRKPYGLRLKYILDDALESSRGLIDIENSLHKQGIRVIFRKGMQGNIFGVTFIDNTTRVVINGSELGKKYSAVAFSEGLRQKTVSRVPVPEMSIAGFSMPGTVSEADGSEVSTSKVPCLDLPVMETIVGSLFYDEPESSDTLPNKKKSKKYNYRDKRGKSVLN